MTRKVEKIIDSLLEREDFGDLAWTNPPESPPPLREPFPGDDDGGDVDDENDRPDRNLEPDDGNHGRDEDDDYPPPHPQTYPVRLSDQDVYLLQIGDGQDVEMVVADLVDQVCRLRPNLRVT